MFELKFTKQAIGHLDAIESNSAQAGLCKQVKKSLGYLQTNPKHPSLNTHPYDAIENPYNPKEKVFEAYVQNKTPSAYRIFWCYTPKQKEITIISITSHP